MSNTLLTALLVCILFTGSVMAGTPVQPTDVLSTANSYTKGRMELSEDQFDFGLSPQDAYVTHSFWIRNVGADTLEIIQVKPG